MNDEKPNNKRKTNGYSSATLHAKRNRKRQEAESRQVEHDKLTTAQKLAKATGVRERDRLSKRLTVELAVKKPALPPGPTKAEKAVRKSVKAVRYGQDLAKSNLVK